MINECEARCMMEELSSLHKKINKSNIDKKKYYDYETFCLEKLKYLVEVKANRYKKFPNYHDLVQDGMCALLKGIRTFNISKLSPKDNGTGAFFFSWVGWFVSTKLVRSANNHTAIRYPMHIAKMFKPHKENTFPLLLDLKDSPEKVCEDSELNKSVKKALKLLSFEQLDIISLMYGLNGNKPLSVTKICEAKKISRNYCNKIVNDALEVLRNKIEI